MLQSVEIYFLINFLMDAALIAVIARANDCFHFRRILAGSLLTASYALAVEMLSSSLAHPLFQIPLICLLSLIVCGERSWHRWSSIAFQLFCGAMMLGGLGTILAPRSFSMTLAGLGLGLLLVSVLLNVRRQRLLSWEVTVCLSLKGKTISFRALIDTGNRLHEPISGLPILIAESTLLQSILPDGSASLPCRSVSFGALGGSGTIRCFHPDAVLIRRGDRMIPAPEVWVAIYPGKIPGTSRALAPPSFAVIHGKS